MNFPMPSNSYNHRIMKTPFGIFDLDIKGRIILNEQYKMYKIMIFEMFNGDIGGYFRGENDKYPTFLTSYQKLTNDIERCLGWLQKREFIDWFEQTPYYEYFAYESEYAPHTETTPKGEGYRFCFDLEAIAQHYEFPTNYIDITTKRDVAKFFAYTHKENGKLVPLEKFNGIQPCLYSSFGSSLENPYNPDMRIVGFQALPRPLNQQAMAINLENCNTDYKKEMQCEELPCDKRQAFNIYDKMEGGKLLMPDDWASRISKQIKSKYENERLIHTLTFEKCCQEFNQKPEDLIKSLANYGYDLSDEHISVTDDAKADMQNDLKKNIIPWINEFVAEPTNQRS